MKRILSLFTAFVMAFSIVLSVPVDTFAAEAKENVWSVGWTADKKYVGYKSDKSDVSVDTKVYCKTGRSSIKITNNDYTQCQVKKTVKVEPLTTYKFSAMVKCSDIKADPSTDKTRTGAHISQRYIVDGDWKSHSVSQRSVSSKWVKLETIFTTIENQHEVDLVLFNGTTGALNKGTIWFSDIKLEKAEQSNQWNVLAIAYKNIDIKIDLYGRTTMLKQNKKGLTHFKDSYTDSEIKEFKNVTSRLFSTIDTMSGGLADIKDIDFVTVNDPITELAEYNYAGDKWGTGKIKGYRIDESSDIFCNIVDKYLDKKYYNAIIILAPIQQISGWNGLNGNYKGTVVTYLSGMSDIRGEFFPEATFVHELIHQLEAQTRDKYDPDIPSLHSRSDYGYTSGEKGDYKWYQDYMRAEIAGTKNKGVDPRAYWLTCGYTLVDGDMSTAGDIKAAARLDITDCSVAKVKDCSYTGKKITPSLTIKDGDYTLKKGVDYTVKFSNNTKKGEATATITGKGLYKGTIKTTFSIVAGKPSVKLEKSADCLTLSWSNFSDVDKYIVWRSTDGGKFKKVCEVDGSKSGKKFKYSKNHTYQFAVTAYNASTGEYSEYIYTDPIKT